MGYKHGQVSGDLGLGEVHGNIGVSRPILPFGAAEFPCHFRRPSKAYFWVWGGRCRSTNESLPDDVYIDEVPVGSEMTCYQENLDAEHVDLEEAEKNDESALAASGEDDGALQGSGKVGADDHGVPLQDRALSPATDGRDAKLVRDALARALLSVEASGSYDDLSPEVLWRLIVQDLGPYENRLRRLRLLLNQAVEEHFARVGSDRAVLEDGKDVRLDNSELRAVVRASLRRLDLRKPCTCLLYTSDAADE